MNKSHAKASINEVKGNIKENVGHAIGNNRMEGEGIIDRLKGKIQKKMGDLKDDAKRSVDRRLEEK